MKTLKTLGTWRRHLAASALILGVVIAVAGNVLPTNANAYGSFTTAGAYVNGPVDTTIQSLINQASAILAKSPVDTVALGLVMTTLTNTLVQHPESASDVVQATNLKRNPVLDTYVAHAMGAAVAILLSRAPADRPSLQTIGTFAAAMRNSNDDNFLIDASTTSGGFLDAAGTLNIPEGGTSRFTTNSRCTGSPC